MNAVRIIPSAVREKLAGRFGQKGETLVEVLVAVLVSAMSMLLLAMAITVASRLVAQSDGVRTNYYGATDNLESVADSTTSSVTITGFGVDGSTTVGVVYDDELLAGGVTAVSYKAV